MTYARLVELSRQAAEITASACASCAKNDGGDNGDNCCRGCAFTGGYLNLPKDQFEAVKLKYGWDPALGFNTNVGCRLPREVRNPVCLRFYCRPIQIKPEYNDPEVLQRYRDRKGFKDPLLPPKLAKLMWEAELDSAQGHRESVALALSGRNSI